MLETALTALAAAGGTAVAQAAGTDAWSALRGRVAGWFGRGDSERERAELERLDSSAAELTAVGGPEAEQVRIRQEASWQARIEILLESLDGEQRDRAVAELRALVEEAAPGAAGPGARVSGNVFQGPTAFQVGNHNRQDNHFGPRA
ncbi:hypothetical protein [Streptomyces sp. NPDC091209]|uniref:hypothetical protein n=1 Tax=Streptomyces sp. NPDC091209 TaxID=3365974 RepID=UPI003800C9C0